MIPIIIEEGIVGGRSEAIERLLSIMTGDSDKEERRKRREMDGRRKGGRNETGDFFIKTQQSRLIRVLFCLSRDIATWILSHRDVQRLVWTNFCS